MTQTTGLVKSRIKNVLSSRANGSFKEHTTYTSKTIVTFTSSFEGALGGGGLEMAGEGWQDCCCWAWAIACMAVIMAAGGRPGWVGYGLDVPDYKEERKEFRFRVSKEAANV